jgi:hypothetical protein
VQVGGQVRDVDGIVEALCPQDGAQLRGQGPTGDDERRSCHFVSAGQATDGPGGSALRRSRRDFTNVFAVSAATAASRQYASAPTALPNSSLSGAPADEDEVLVAQALFDQGVDDHLHVRHRRGQQRRHPQDVGLVQFERGEELVDVGVDAEVDHLEAGAFEHHRREVLADVVDVALHGSDDDLADRLGAGLGEQRAKHGHPSLHGVRREQHFRHEQDPVAEVDTDDPHPFDQRVVEHLLGPQPRSSRIVVPSRISSASPSYRSSCIWATRSSSFSVARSRSS